jgi:hypothetical protein
MNGLGRWEFHQILWLLRAIFYKHFDRSSNQLTRMLFRDYIASAGNVDFNLSPAQLAFEVMKVCIFIEFKPPRELVVCLFCCLFLPSGIINVFI